MTYLGKYNHIKIFYSKKRFLWLKAEKIKGNFNPNGFEINNFSYIILGKRFSTGLQIVRSEMFKKFYKEIDKIESPFRTLEENIIFIDEIFRKV